MQMQRMNMRMPRIRIMRIRIEFIRSISIHSQYSHYYLLCQKIIIKLLAWLRMPARMK